jgi:2-haloacid dehalogenase
MAPRRITTIVFDIGNVLLDWDPRHLYRQLIKDPDELAHFLTNICTPSWHLAHDLGADINRSCRELASRHPRHADLIMAWAGRGDEMIAGPIEGSVRLLHELRQAGLRCLALSNMEPDRFRQRLARYSFLGSLDGYVISGFEGVAKPDPRIYEILRDRFALAGDATLFIDDNAANVTAARAAGLRAVRFVSPEHLREHLTGLGLLPAGQARGAA